MPPRRMQLNDKAIAVLTYETASDIVKNQGLGTWVLNERRALQQTYLVCCRPVLGTQYPDAVFEAFLVAKMDRPFAVATTESDQKRYRIPITRYALVDLQLPWRDWRNPVKYTSLDKLGLDAETLHLDSCLGAKHPSATPTADPDGIQKLTLIDAKRGLAAMLGIKPEQIEIEVRIRT